MAVQSVERALKILSLFSHRRPLLGISELSEIMDLPKGTVHGLTRTLVEKGFLSQDSQTRKYRLGLKIHELGIVLSGTLDLNQKAAGPCERLSGKTGLLSRIGIWDGGSVVITMNIHPSPMPVLPHQVGPRIHAYCSGIGKAILAFLDAGTLDEYLDGIRLTPFTPATITSRTKLLADLEETRSRGYSLDCEEALKGLGCIGAPVFDQQASVAGAISLSGNVGKVLGENLESLAGDVVAAAAEISRLMGYYPDLSQAGAFNL